MKFNHVDRINEVPGTSRYTGKYKTEPIVIEVYSYDDKQQLYKKCESIEEIKIDQKVQWINIIGLHDMNLLKSIGNKFNISQFVLEDIVQVSRYSKIELFDDYIFSIFKMLYLENDKIMHEHVSILKVENTIITFQETSGDVFGSIRHRIENGLGNIRVKEADYLYYCMIDALIDQYFDILPYVSERLDQLEYEIIEENDTMIESVYKIRKELALINSSVSPLKGTLQKFLKQDDKFVSDEVKEYFKDILDHLDQINEKVVIYKEVISSLFETHMSNISNKMNRVMTTLTIFSAIFIPLSFLASFFGMNFIHFPGLASKYGIPIFSVICVIISGGMFGFFKFKKLL